MLYADLLRLTVLLAAGDATALGAISVVAAKHGDNNLTLILAAAWWLIAAIIGVLAARRESSVEPVRRALTAARTMTSLPSETPGRIAVERLWPLGLFALVCGGLAWVWPQVAAIGAGYAILFALAWRNREAYVIGVEDRDGVRFYVEPASALRPLQLTRTPGLSRDRFPAGHPPPAAPG